MRSKTLFNRFLSTILFALIAFSAQAQDGTIRGKIYDDSGMEASFATVQVLELENTGATADLEGSFVLSLSPGTYTLQITYVGFGDMKVTDVVSKAGEVTVIEDITLKNESEELVEIVVTARASRNTTNSVMNLQKKSVNLLDGVSVQAISQSGDSDAGAAIKRITGVTVEDGKNVYVRGLGDRYTKTVLNGMEIPGLDPDRNNVQVDVFPANILNNILVYKTFTPDLSGDFTGGTVDIELKNFPEERMLSYGGSLGYNANTTFNNNFQTYNASLGDAFAFGAGARKSPIANSTVIPLAVTGATGQEDIIKKFGDEMSVDRTTALPNQSYNFSWGNQFNGEKLTKGLVFAVNYKNSNNFYENAIFNSYFKPADKSEFELTPTDIGYGAYSTNETMWSGLVSGSIKGKLMRHSLSLFHTQNGIKKASEIRSENFFSNEGGILDKDVLYYNQKSITNLVYGNRIDVPSKNLQFNVKFAPSMSLNKEPDIRTTAFAVELDDAGQVTDYSLNPGDGAGTYRFYRDLQEFSFNTKADVSWKFKQWGGLDAKIKGGFAHAYKMRDFSVLQYEFRERGSRIQLAGDPNQLFEEENLFDASTNQGVFVSGQSEPSNTYSANSQVAAAYVMNELPLSRKLKTIYGLRVEKTDMRYTGQRQTINNAETDVFENKNVLNEFDFLPSFNLIYSVVDNMNLRGAYSRTLARPSFKEKSLAQIYDPVSERTFIGNLDLVQTYVQNMDVRWEYFFKPGEMLSVSGFYKDFTNPIEIVAYSSIAPDNFTPRNVGNAKVYGVEFETRKNLGFIAPALQQLSLGTNVSYIKSEVKMNEAEYEGRVQEAREGEVISDTREMQGQSPFIINTNINYAAPESGWNVNLSYNVQGRRLSVVGVARVADVYENQFHSLNFKASKFFGTNNNWKVSLNAQNILDQRKEKVYQSYNAADQVFAAYNPGRAFSVGVGYMLRGTKTPATKLAKK